MGSVLIERAKYQPTHERLGSGQGTTLDTQQMVTHLDNDPFYITIFKFYTRDIIFLMVSRSAFTAADSKSD